MPSDNTEDQFQGQLGMGQQGPELEPNQTQGVEACVYTAGASGFQNGPGERLVCTWPGSSDGRPAQVVPGVHGAGPALDYFSLRGKLGSPCLCSKLGTYLGLCL